MSATATTSSRDGDCPECGLALRTHVDDAGRARDCAFARKKARRVARREAGPVRLEDIPARLDADWMMRIFEVNSSRFYELKAAGYFDRLELKPEVGHTRWSGELVKAYLRGELHWHVHAPRKKKRGPKPHALQQAG
jgi:hypothetical protein